jgi:hypothetical protein
MIVAMGKSANHPDNGKYHEDEKEEKYDAVTCSRPASKA